MVLLGLFNGIAVLKRSAVAINDRKSILRMYFFGDPYGAFATLKENQRFSEPDGFFDLFVR